MIIVAADFNNNDRPITKHPHNNVFIVYRRLPDVVKLLKVEGYNSNFHFI
jgi:hypothetical protein